MIAPKKPGSMPPPDPEMDALDAIMAAPAAEAAEDDEIAEEGEEDMEQDEPDSAPAKDPGALIDGVMAELGKLRGMVAKL